MIPDKVYEIGGMLGLEHKDLRDLVISSSVSDKTNISETPPSPVDVYPKGELYGTVSKNDF